MAFEQCRLFPCHWGANGICTHASEDTIRGTSLNYQQTTADLCWSNSNLNQNKQTNKQKSLEILCCTVQY